MKAKKDVQPGTLALMVLKTLDVMGELTDMALPGVSSRLVETSFLSIREHFIQSS